MAHELRVATDLEAPGPCEVRSLRESSGSRMSRTTRASAAAADATAARLLRGKAAPKKGGSQEEAKGGRVERRGFLPGGQAPGRSTRPGCWRRCPRGTGSLERAVTDASERDIRWSRPTDDASFETTVARYYNISGGDGRRELIAAAALTIPGASAALSTNPAPPRPGFPREAPSNSCASQRKPMLWSFGAQSLVCLSRGCETRKDCNRAE